MRRAFDLEYRREMEQVVETGMRSGIWAVWFQLVVATAILGGVILLCVHFRAPAALLISATFAAATLCLIAIFSHGMIVINGSLAVIASAIEWADERRLEASPGGKPIGAELLVGPVSAPKVFGVLARRH